MRERTFVFEENNITFLLDRDNKVMVNATEMAKVFNAEVKHFMENLGTQQFISACLKTRNSEFLNSKSEEDLYTSKQKTGTFMHRVLALKFAAWLSPEFELWVYSTIDALLFSKYAEREKSLEKTIALQRNLKLITVKDNKTGEDFENYLNIEHELRKEKTYRTHLTKQTVCELLTLFDSSY